MVTRKNVSFTVDNKIHSKVGGNFDNKSKLLAYIIIQIISQNEKFKELTKNYCY